MDEVELRRRVIGRLKTDVFTATTGGANAWSSDISENTIRNIVGMWMVGDNTGDRRVTIEKVEEDDTTTDKFPSIPVATDGFVAVHTTYDLFNPILRLEGGTNLKGTVDGGTGVDVILNYWDEIID